MGLRLDDLEEALKCKQHLEHATKMVSLCEKGRSVVLSFQTNPGEPNSKGGVTNLTLTEDMAAILANMIKHEAQSSVNKLAEFGLLQK